MCNCMEVIDKKLAEADANTRVSRTYTLSASMGMFPTIATEKADKSVRKKPMAIMPSFCPWCGLSYKTGLPGTDAQQAGES